MIFSCNALSLAHKLPSIGVKLLLSKTTIIKSGLTKIVRCKAHQLICVFTDSPTETETGESFAKQTRRADDDWSITVRQT